MTLVLQIWFVGLSARVWITVSVLMARIDICTDRTFLFHLHVDVLLASVHYSIALEQMNSIAFVLVSPYANAFTSPSPHAVDRAVFPCTLYIAV